MGLINPGPISKNFESKTQKWLKITISRRINKIYQTRFLWFSTWVSLILSDYLTYFKSLIWLLIKKWVKPKDGTDISVATSQHKKYPENKNKKRCFRKTLHQLLIFSAKQKETKITETFSSGFGPKTHLTPEPDSLVWMSVKVKVTSASHFLRQKGVYGSCPELAKLNSSPSTFHQYLRSQFRKKNLIISRWKTTICLMPRLFDTELETEGRRNLIEIVAIIIRPYCFTTHSPNVKPAKKTSNAKKSKKCFLTKNS